MRRRVEIWFVGNLTARRMAVSVRGCGVRDPGVNRRPDFKVASPELSDATYSFATVQKRDVSGRDAIFSDSTRGAFCVMVYKREKIEGERK